LLLSAWVVLVLGSFDSASGDVIPLVGKSGEKKSPELLLAEKFFHQGDYEKCMQSLESAVARDSKLAPSYLLLARLFIASGQLPAAGRQFLDQRAVKFPSNPAIYLAFAQFNLAEGRFVEASALIDKAANLVESNAAFAGLRSSYLRECWSGKAFLAEHRQDWLGVQTALNEWLKIDPKNAAAHQRMGRALFHLDRPQDALAALQQAHSIDPAIEHPFVGMGLLWTQKKDMKQADQWMQKAAEEARDAPTRRTLAGWMLDRGRIDDAVQHADAALRLDPGSVDGKRLRGLVYRYQREFARAEEIFEALYRDSPGDFFVSNQLALSLAEQADGKKLARAKQLAEVNTRQWPNLGDAHATLGRVYYLLGQWNDAERVMQTASGSGKLSSDSAYYYACILEQTRKPDDARKLLRAALDASGPFLFRREAEELLARVDKQKK
jgi:superkiller protein 3